MPKGIRGISSALLLVGVGLNANQALAAAPIARADSARTPAGVAVSIPVMANDSDPDGNTFIIGSFPTVGKAAHGTVVRKGKFAVYTPAAGFSGTDSFTYRLKDSTNAWSTAAKVTVTVSAPSNTPPVARADNANTTSPDPVTINLLANDTDANGDKLTVTANSVPANGTVTRSGGMATYTPAPGFSGTNTFNYRVSDGKGGASSATVTITVAPKPNTAPVAGADSASTTSPNAVTVNLLANDTDADGDVLSVTANTAPANGAVTRSGDSATYTPAAGFSGTDSFSYDLSDGKGGTTTGTVSITVAPKPNTAPVAGPDSASTTSPDQVTVNVLANDTDADGDVLSIPDTTAPANGTVTRSGGSLTYTPANGFSGTDSFAYTLTDGNGGMTSGLVTVTVEPPPAPAAVNRSAVLSWSIPTTRANGAPLSMAEIAGYEIYLVAESTGQRSVIPVKDANATSYTVQDLPADTYHFSMAAMDSDGNLSELSSVVSKVIGP